MGNNRVNRINTAVGRTFCETYFEHRTEKGRTVVVRHKLPTAERVYHPGDRPLTDKEVMSVYPTLFDSGTEKPGRKEKLREERLSYRR